MKRIVAWLVVVVFLLGGLAGCNKKDNNTQFSTEKIPPSELTVRCGTQSVQALRGSTSWEYLVGEDEWDGEEAEDIHPLMSKDLMPCLEFSESDEELIVTMDFDIAPIDIFVLRWDESDWNDVTAEAEDIRVIDGTFVLSEENSIYEISARWYSNEGNKLQGMIYYSFYTEKAS